MTARRRTRRKPPCAMRSGSTRRRAATASLPWAAARRWISLNGLVKAWKYVERATRDGQDREARYNMAMAAMEGAMVFQKGLGAVHALSHPTGGLKGYRLHHGTLNAVYLPAVLRFNAPAV